MNSIKSIIEVEFDNAVQAEIVHKSILLEFESSPDYRSQMDVTREGNVLFLHIVAEDATSFRASLNSAIKWMKLSLEINELTD